METINYAKDFRKPIVALLTELNFQPYGALGAISAGAVKSMTIQNDGVSANLVTQLANTLSTQKPKKPAKNVTDPAKVCFTHYFFSSFRSKYIHRWKKIVIIILNLFMVKIRLQY